MADIKTLTTDFQDDISPEERRSLQDYIDNGRPGLVKTTESDIFKWFEMYMSGKTYTEIAKVNGVRKDLVVYMSNKMKWFDKKMEHYSDLASSLSMKSAAMKLETANTLHSIVMRLSKYYNDKMARSSVDPTIVDTLDTRLMQQYNKSIEMFNKVMGDSSKPDSSEPKNPLVNINMTGGSIKQIDDDTIEITDEMAGDLLKTLAGMKKNKIE